MRPQLFTLLLVPFLLLSFPPLSQAARKGKTSAKASGYDEVPAINWKLVSTGFIQVFGHRNEEIESAEPNRFFHGTVAFALGRMDEGGHFLTLSCGGSQACGSRRDELEERVVKVCLLDSVHTPKVHKSQLYNERTWALTELGEKYVAIIHKRHPDLYTRLGRMMGSALGSR